LSLSFLLTITQKVCDIHFGILWFYKYTQLSEPVTITCCYFPTHFFLCTLKVELSLPIWLV
jgi:hypothetical protein